MPNSGRKSRGRSTQQSQQQQRGATGSSRPPSLQRQQPGQGRGAPGGASGGASNIRPGAGSQTSVRDMISRLDSTRQPASGSQSPSKRRRSSRDVSLESDSVSAASSTARDSAQPLTEATLNSALLKLADRFKRDMSVEFAALKNDIERLHGRIQELEQHVASRDCAIDELQQRLSDRDVRISDLEINVDRLQSQQRKKDLILTGSAVPTPPQEHWNEDVTDTAVTLLGRCLPDVPVTRDDITDAFRIGKQRRIVCRFKSASKNSVRDRLYENRFKSKSVNTHGVAEPSSLYINENLSPYRQTVFQALLKEKQAKRIYTVYTKNGEVFCKTQQYGRKIKVESLQMIASVVCG